MDHDQHKQAVAGIFTRAAETYDHVGPSYFAHFGQQLVNAANIPAGASVLDIASGRGAVLFPAADRVGPHGYVHGIDIAEGMVKETGAEIVRLGLKNADLRVMDAENLTFPDASFDFIVSGFSLFFYPHLDRALAGFMRVLKPGGKVAFSTWGSPDALWTWTYEIAQKYRSSHEQSPYIPTENFNTADKMRAVMTTAGFADIQVTDETFEVIYADEDEWLTSQWSHGTRGQWEVLDPAVQEQWKTDLITGLRALKQPDGLHRRMNAIYTVAKKAW